MMSYLWILLLGSLLIGAQSQEVTEAEEPAGDLEAAEPEAAPEEVPAAAEETEATEPEAAPEEVPTDAEETEPAEPEAAPEEVPAAAEETEATEPEAAPEEVPTAAEETEPAEPEATSETEPAEETEAVEPDAGDTEVVEPDATAEPLGETEGFSEETVAEEKIVPAEGEKTEEEAAPDEPAAGDGDLNLADALGAVEEGVKPGRGRSGGSVAHTAEAASDGSAEAQEASSGSAVAGILSAVGVALVGAISGYFAYQKKKLCFKNRDADPQDQQSPMTYSWAGLEGTLLSSSSIGQKLSIAVKDRHDEAVIQCSVSNLVSKKQAQFQVKNCFTDESSSTVLAVCLALLCLVILLIVAVGLWFYKRHKKAKPARNKKDDVEDPLMQEVPEHDKTPHDSPPKGQVKEKRELFESLARQHSPKKGRLDEQNGNKKQENIERTEDNSHRATLPSTQALPQQAQSEERSNPPTPSQASMIQSDQNILQHRPEQETVPDQDPESVRVSLPDLAKPNPDSIPEGPTCLTKQDTGAGETGHQEQQNTNISEQTGLLANPNNPIQVGSEPEAPKNQLDTNTEAKSEVSAEGHHVEISESCSTSPGRNKDGLKEAEKGIETRNGETERKTNDGGIDEDAMDQNGEEAIRKTEQEREHCVSESSPASMLSPKKDQINGSTPDTVAVSKHAEPSQVQSEPNQSEHAGDLSQQAEDSAQSQTKPTDTSTPKLTSDTQPPALTPTKPSAECNRSDPPSPSQVSMIQSDQKILQTRPKQETVPDQDPAVSVVSLPDQKSEVAAHESITKEPTDQAIPDPGPEGPTCPTKQDTGAGETGHQKQPDTNISEQTGLLANPNNPTQVGSEAEALKNQLDTNKEGKPESCSTSPGGEEGDEDELETRDGETERKTNDGGIDEDAMDQNGEEAIRKTEQEREHCVSESSPASMLSPKKDQINGSTPDTVAVSKHAEPSQVQSEPNQSEHAGDLSQQAEDSAQSQTKPTDTSTPKLTSDTQPPALTPTKPSAECNRSDPPSPSQVSMIQSDQKILQTRPKQETVPDQDPAVSVVSLPDQKSEVAAHESITKEPTGQAIPDPGPEGPTCPTKQDTGAGETGHQKQPDTNISEQTGLLANPNNPTQVGSEAEALKNQLDTNKEGKPESCSTSPGGEEGDEDELETRDGETERSPASTLSSKEDQINGSTPDTATVSKHAEPGQVQPEPDDSKAVGDVDNRCQQKPNSQSCSISPGGVVGSEEGSKEAEEEMEAGDVEKEKPEGGVDHSMGISRSMETEDEENKTSAVEVGNTEQQSMKEEKTGTDESAEQHPDPGEKADVSSQSDTVETAEVEKNANNEQDDKKDGGGIKVDSQMDGAGSDEQADDNSDAKAKGTEQGETNRKLED
ncbi:uncharacterized protein si:ch211-39i22.1 [Osmerus eperlanus]|uniref:uncharacterized protein si:ch211-39i22.1 n=1 Tax=Osmerus eperlanus TaxID=29151 RepID=UPI002E10D3E2